MGKLGVNQFFAHIAQLGLGQTANDTACRGSCRTHGIGAERHLHTFLHVAECDVAHFMADHRFDFVIRHHVHQPAVNADTAVRHRKRIHVFCHIDFVIHCLAIDVIAQRGGNLVQTLRVSATGRCDGCFSVHLFTRLVAQRDDLRIAQGISLEGFCARAHQTV
ncbi:hypothetical protein D3C72_1662930 [compost metagenome]